jgi:hypothetical protein
VLLLRALSVCAVLGASFGLSLPVEAQQKILEHKKAEFQKSTAGATTPDDYKLAMLIKTTIIAVNQANMTGNYSVLRDLGTPAFQSVNNPSRLSDAFSLIRQRNLDLSPILFFDPKLVAKPNIQENGVLSLRGFLPTAPEQVEFEFAFQFSDGRWKLDGIALGMQKASTVKNAADVSASKEAAKR